MASNSIIIVEDSIVTDAMLKMQGFKNIVLVPLKISTGQAVDIINPVIRHTIDNTIPTLENNIIDVYNSAKEIGKDVLKPLDLVIDGFNKVVSKNNKLYLIVSADVKGLNDKYISKYKKGGKKRKQTKRKTKRRKRNII